ncbi:MAG: hypothetical protein GF398_12475 [Chitinivibrionales bacterium]|nr:hypothetical protein [Chitinivibrionales bacterium]
MKKTRVTLCLAGIFMWQVAGQSYDELGDAYYSNANRDIFALPQSSAMARSDILFAADGTAQGNPAVLPGLERQVVELAYAGFYENTFSTSLLSFAAPVSKNMGVSASFNYLYVPGISDNRGWDTLPGGAPIVGRDKQFSASELLFRVGFGYNFQITRNLHLGVGAALNSMRRNLEGPIGYGIGVDGSTVLHLVPLGFRIGFQVNNLTTNYLRWQPGYVDLAYPQLRFSMGWASDVDYLYGRLQLHYTTLDIAANSGNNTVTKSDEYTSLSMPSWTKASEDPVKFLIRGNLGGEYLIRNIVAVRIGTSRINPVTFGAGLNLFDQHFSMNFAYLYHELAGTYQLSIGYGW